MNAPLPDVVPVVALEAKRKYRSVVVDTYTIFAPDGSATAAADDASGNATADESAPASRNPNDPNQTNLNKDSSLKPSIVNNILLDRIIPIGDTKITI